MQRQPSPLAFSDRLNASPTDTQASRTSSSPPTRIASGFTSTASISAAPLVDERGQPHQDVADGAHRLASLWRRTLQE